MLTGFLISDKILVLAAGDSKIEPYPHGEQINLCGVELVFGIEKSC